MISEGEKITGKLNCSPNVRNNRDLDITINYILPDGSGEVSIDYKMYGFVLVNFPVFDLIQGLILLATAHFSPLMLSPQL
jgi:hypothetical protein